MITTETLLNLAKEFHLKYPCVTRIETEVFNEKIFPFPCPNGVLRMFNGKSAVLPSDSEMIEMVGLLMEFDENYWSNWLDHTIDQSDPFYVALLAMIETDSEVLPKKIKFFNEKIDLIYS